MNFFPVPVTPQLPEVIPTTHIVQYSGGAGSFATALWLACRVPRDRILLLFADTKAEDPDVYAFLKQSAAYLGVKLEWLSEGRGLWEIFKDVRHIGNTRVDPRSRILKREQCKKYVEANFTPLNCRIYVGIDWTEEHRMENVQRIWDPYVIRAPLVEEKSYDKNKFIEWMRAQGFIIPSLYEQGFPHANCGGFCIKAGIAHFLHLLEKRPQVYAYHEQQEEELRQYLGKDVSILRDRRKKITGRNVVPLTLRQLRLRADEERKTEDGQLDWGGCGCMSPSEEELAAKAGKTVHPFYILARPFKYRLISDDKPWGFNNRRATRADNPQKKTKFGPGASQNYSAKDLHEDGNGTMKLADLMKVGDSLADLLADDCYLLQWSSAVLPQEALDVMKAWGFRFVTKPFYWVKTYQDLDEFFEVWNSYEEEYDLSENFLGVDWRELASVNGPDTWADGRNIDFSGIGSYVPSNVEEVLLGVRGKPWHSTKGYKPQQVIRRPHPRIHDGVRSKIIHSRKPDEYWNRVERWLSHQVGPEYGKMELFATQRRFGWDGLGHALSGLDINEELKLLRKREEWIRFRMENRILAD